MKGAMGELDEVMPNSLELPSKNYHYWFNGDKIAWIASTWLYDLFMVVVAVVLYAYRYLVLNYSLSIDEFPLQNYLRVLSFENEAHSTVAFWSLIMAVLALVASALTFKAGVVVCSSGGVRDEFALSKKDRQKMYSFLENSRSSPLASSSKEAVAKIDKKTSKLVAKQKKKELQSTPRSSKTDSSSQTGDLESVTKPSASKPSSLSHSEDLALDGELKEDRPTVLPPSESLPEVSLGEDEKEGRLTIEAPITSSSDEAEEP